MIGRIQSCTSTRSRVEINGSPWWDARNTSKRDIDRCTCKKFLVLVIKCYRTVQGQIKTKRGHFCYHIGLSTETEKQMNRKKKTCRNYWTCLHVDKASPLITIHTILPPKVKKRNQKSSKCVSLSVVCSQNTNSCPCSSKFKRPGARLASIFGCSNTDGAHATSASLVWRSSESCGFFRSERKRAALGQEAQTDFPGGKRCSPVMDLQRKNTMSSEEKQPRFSPPRLPRSCWTILPFTLGINNRFFFFAWGFYWDWDLNLLHIFPKAVHIFYDIHAVTSLL